MVLYFNCYVLGNGYTICRLNKMDNGDKELETISLRELPAYLAASFTQSGTELRLDREGKNWYGYARNIPYYLRDESGRNCYLNMAMTADPGNVREEEAVRAVLAFARDRKDAFSAYMSKVVYYPSLEYAIDLKALDAMIAAALAENGGAAEVFSLSEGLWLSDAPDRNVYFYCSTPSMGYTLRKIEPSSGLAYRYGTKKGMTCTSQLLPYAQKLLNSGGAEMALFEQNGRCGFIVKGVKSTAKDNSAKKLSFLMDVPSSEERWLTRMATYALFSPAAFAALLLDCVEIYSDPRGFRILPEKLSAFFATFDRELRLPDNADREGVRLWQQINRVRKRPGFHLIVLETTYEYFEKVCGISIPDNSGTALVSYKQAEKLAAQRIELIQAEEKSEERIVRPSSPHQTQSTLVPENANECADNGPPPEKAAEEQKVSALIEQNPKEAATDADLSITESMSAEENPDEDEADEDGDIEEESINLLDYKWFMPSVIATVLIMAAIVLFILFSKNQGGLP